MNSPMIELTSTLTGAKIFALASAIALITKDKSSASGRGSVVFTTAGTKFAVSENPTTILFLLAGSPGVTYKHPEHPHGFFSTEAADETSEPVEGAPTKLDALMEFWPRDNAVATDDSAPVGSASGDAGI